MGNMEKVNRHDPTERTCVQAMVINPVYSTLVQVCSENRSEQIS